MEWPILIVLIAIIVKKFNKLKILRVEWGVVYLEFEVTPIQGQK